MKLPSYKDIIRMTKEKKDEVLAPIRALQMKKQGEIEIAKVDEGLITQEQRINELCTKYPICYSQIIDAIDELAIMERRKEQLKKIISELFPEKED